MFLYKIPKVLGIWFGKDHINTNWLQIQNKVKIQFEKWKDRRLSLRHKVLIINTYILSKILYCMSGTCWPPLQKGCIRDFLCRYSKLPPQNIVYMYLLIICMCFADGGTMLAT
jgi:hypothetical protein